MNKEYYFGSAKVMECLQAWKCKDVFPRSAGSAFRACGKVGEEEAGWVLLLLNTGTWICGHRCLCVLGVGGRLGVRLRAWMTCRMGASSMQVKVYFRRQTHGTSEQERAPLGAERPLQTFWQETRKLCLPPSQWGIYYSIGRYSTFGLLQL